jgi:serine/threonine-protein phosphatase 2B regulatory subunit
MGNQQSSSVDSSFVFSKAELKILYQNFMNLDTDKSGQIEQNEFFDVPELKDNPIVQRVISVFDKNNDGKISFYEFILGLSALTDNANKDEKLKFAFQIYDSNNDGYISNGDLFNTLKLLVGDNLTDIQIQQVVDRTLIAADKDQDGKLSYEEFANFVQDMKIYELFSIDLFK